MSSENLRNVNHYSNIIMRPLSRAFAFGVAALVVYNVVKPAKNVEPIRPYYEEYRKAKGLPAIPIKHPGWVKEMREVPKEEFIKRNVN